MTINTIVRAEARAAHAMLEGANTGMSQSYAKEVVQKMHGRHMSELPDHSKAKPKVKLKLKSKSKP